MANLTTTVDEQVLKKARMRALGEDTSVNAVLREYLEDYSGLRRERLEAGQRILEMSRNSSMGSGGQGLPKREELYDREICRDRASKKR